MKFSFSLPGHGPLATIENVLAAGREAEALGFDSIFIIDFSITHTRENHRFNVGCGSAEAIRCCLDVFGSQSVVFGTDYPWGPDGGRSRLAT